MKRKILFLDIDGVVNNAGTFKKYKQAEFPIEPYCAFLVGKIQLETGCEVVLSSSWRKIQKEYDFVNDRIVTLTGKTGTCCSGIRGVEIYEWIQDNVDYKVRDQLQYAILDDEGDMLLWQKDNFFKTDWKTGLTDEIANQVIEHLNKTMTNQTPYNQLRQILTDRLPHLKELSFGCEVIRGSDFGGSAENVFIGNPYECKNVLGKSQMQVVNPYNLDDTDDLLEIIGHPPTLQDVLLAIDKRKLPGLRLTLHAKTNLETLQEDKALCFGIYDGKVLPKGSFYDLTKPLANQSDETLLALIELVK